uniref:Ig-like domain-containing protein n=1 Tax=Oncorhynchus mykiss TaxID=8022 RepID=A0A8K9USA4_ONCMY
MIKLLIHLATLPLWVTVILYISDGLFSSTGSMVHQRPVALTEGPGGDFQLTCSHTIPNYYVILWYKQSAGDTAMKLIGYANYKSITMEKSFEKHFNVSGDGGKEAYLHLVSLRGPEHSAVYYCAASHHSDTKKDKSFNDVDTGMFHNTPLS